MHVKEFGCILIILFGVFCTACSATACQDQPAGAEKSPSAAAEAIDGATIRGQIVAPESLPFEFDLTTLPVTIAEPIRYKPLPLPPDWGTRTMEQQRQWIKEFQESDAGKEFMEAREAQIKNQRRISLKIDPDGHFEIFDVPLGDYNLFGRKDVEVDSKKYAVEVFGQISVAQPIDPPGSIEVELQPLPIAVTRLLSAGEVAPALDVDLLADGGARISLGESSGHPVLVYFWTANREGASDDFVNLKKAIEVLGPELQLELLAICVDESPDKAREISAAKELPGRQGRTDGWKHAAFFDYGLRSVPAFFLVGADGKLLMTNEEFFRAFAGDSPDLASIIRNAIQPKQPAAKQ